MKKVITLLFAIITLFTATSFAQPGSICNATFTYNAFVVNGTTNITQFFSASPNTATFQHQWIFGDGSFSYDYNPAHSYFPGTYNVVHVVTYYSPNDSTVVSCTDSFSRFIAISDSNFCYLDANFSFISDSIQTNTVHFNNLSTGANPNNIKRWSFGDGTFSYENNPVHTYQTAGEYLVCLAVKNDSLCTDDTCKVVQVQLPTNTCNLQAYFNNAVDSSNNLLVHFFNQSPGILPGDSLQWSFGDGSITVGNNPSHAYNQGGTYNVCLLITRYNSGSVPCVREYCKTITLLPTPPPVCYLHAGFIAFRDSTQNNTVYFNNTSTGLTPVTSIRWSFGDGSFSYDHSPIHTYQTPGTYTVCLSVKRDSLCTDDTCMVVQVQAANTCNLQVNFASQVDSMNHLLVHFYNQSAPLSSTDSVTWIFGDGSISHDLNPSHTYSQGSTYNVCLVVKKNTAGSVPCVREFCSAITLQPAPPPVCNIHSNFSFVRDSIQTNTVYFTNLSMDTVPWNTLRWSFGDGNFSSYINPTHTYQTSGAYTVCLLITRDSLCAADTCKVVQVQVNNCNLQPYFNNAVDSSNNLLVHFFNQSPGTLPGDSLQWSFGDGSITVGNNPSHTYNQGGTYNVCLLVTRYNNSGTVPCVREYCKAITLQPTTTCNLSASFTYASDSINGGSANVYHFTNTSTPLTNVDSSFWDFGDGSPVVINPNNPVTHEYRIAGAYTVCLKVKKVLPGSTFVVCERQSCQTIVVDTTQLQCNLQAHFSYSIDSIATNKIYFYNQTIGFANTDSVSWTFGDGSSSNSQNPVHTYNTGGSYQVCLRVKRQQAPGTLPCVDEYCGGIVVTQPATCIVNAAFSWRTDSSNTPRIYFSNHSTGVAANYAITWTFGDGSSSNEWAPIHTYAQPGQYTACLKIVINGTSCMSDTCQVIIATGNQQDSCTLRANFTSTADSSNRRKIYFNNTSLVNTAQASAHWSFGDGTAGVSWNADHVYATPGNYLVCLTVTAGNCTSTSCDSILVQGNPVPPLNCDSIHLNFVYRRDAYMSNKLFFFATSNRPILQQQWTFRSFADNSTITVNQPDPVHVFGDTGYYSVCLRANYWAGCVKEACNTIRINRTNMPAQCMLRAYPNPAHNQVSVNAELQQAGIITIAVFNSQNVLLMQRTQMGTTGNNLVTLNIHNLCPGFYTMRIMYGGKVCYTRFQKI